MSFRLPRRLALLFISLLGTYTLSAQSYSLKIQFTDASTEEKVAGVAVAISKAGSETVEKFSQTDENGQATLTGIAAGKYTSRASCWAMRPSKKPSRSRRTPTWASAN